MNIGHRADAGLALTFSNRTYTLHSMYESRTGYSILSREICFPFEIEESFALAENGGRWVRCIVKTGEQVQFPRRRIGVDTPLGPAALLPPCHFSPFSIPFSSPFPNF